MRNDPPRGGNASPTALIDDHPEPFELNLRGYTRSRHFFSPLRGVRKWPAVGNRVRVGLAAPQPLTAELTAPATDRLHIQPGDRLVATWKATATRLLPL